MTLERRHIPLEGGSNVRDIGGYAAADGRTVRWEAVYRSGALWRLSEADWRWIEARGITAVCDLRSLEERELAPTVWASSAAMRQVDQPYDAVHLFGSRKDEKAGVGEVEVPLYLLFARLLAPSLRLFFAALLDGHIPALVHCSAGQDRTGLAIGLLLSALGVDRADVLADYSLSSEFRRTENEIDRESLDHLSETNAVARFYQETIRRRGPDAFKPRALLNAAGEPLLMTAFNAIETEWGSITAYLDRELGIGAAETERLRDTLLEDVDG